MKRYFAYLSTAPELFKYAPEDDNGTVNFPINSVISKTAERDEPIFVCVVVWKGIPDSTLIDFKQELYGIHPKNTTLKILRIKELWPRYLMNLTDYLISNKYIENKDIMYWDASNSLVAQCFHTLFVYGCEFFDEIYCEKVVMVLGDTIFDVTTMINVEESIRMLKVAGTSHYDDIIHQILTMGYVK